MSQWYITRYARLSNGKVELISYTLAPNLAEAKLKEYTRLPNDEFYKAESVVGSLLPAFKPYWIAREKYSHKPKVVLLQIKAENIANGIIDAEDVTFKGTMDLMKKIEPFLTKAQYDATLKALMRKPSVMKYLYERNN